MRKDVYHKKYTLDSSGDHRPLNLFKLLSYLEDIAVDHAEAMGLGYEQMVRSQTFWVLTRQKLNMDFWPQDGTIEVQTWSRSLKGISATRDFEIFYNEKKIGDSSTRWMVLDAVHRRPARPTIDHEIAVTRTDYELSYNAEKIEIQTEVQTIAEINVMPSDLDQNNHVNNTKYGQWLMNAVSDREEYSAGLKSYEINFMSETHLGDNVLIQSKEISQKPSSTFYQGRRKGDQQILFVSTLTTA